MLVSAGCGVGLLLRYGWRMSVNIDWLPKNRPPIGRYCVAIPDRSHGVRVVGGVRAHVADVCGFGDIVWTSPWHCCGCCVAAVVLNIENDTAQDLYRVCDPLCQTLGGTSKLRVAYRVVPCLPFADDIPILNVDRSRVCAYRPMTTSVVYTKGYEHRSVHDRNSRRTR